MNRRSFVNKLLGFVAIAPAAPAIVEKITTYIPPPAQPSLLLSGTWHSDHINRARLFQDAQAVRLTGLENARQALEDAFRAKFEKMFCDEMVGDQVDLYKEKV